MPPSDLHDEPLAVLQTPTKGTLVLLSSFTTHSHKYCPCVARWNWRCGAVVLAGSNLLHWQWLVNKGQLLASCVCYSGLCLHCERLACRMLNMPLRRVNLSSAGCESILVSRVAIGAACWAELLVACWLWPWMFLFHWKPSVREASCLEVAVCADGPPLRDPLEYWCARVIGELRPGDLMDSC